MQQANILVIYSGGTIGMVEDPDSLTLRPFDFEHLSEQVPELNKLHCNIHCTTLGQAVDSSNMNPSIWQEIAKNIEKEYNNYDGFVILHGSDTMAYTASALSFMFENLAKPVILTGSQLPIGVIRTDGKENFLTAIEIASARKTNGEPRVPEVAIYFEYKLFRGNRTHKYSAENFKAFHSPNYLPLAEAGVHIRFSETEILPFPKGEFKVHYAFDCSLTVLFLFPGIAPEILRSQLHNQQLRAVILYTYGAGNATTDDWFIDEIEQALKRGLIVLNITQCQTGSVNQGRYETSRKLRNLGVIGGNDLTIEAGISKLMSLMGRFSNNVEVSQHMQTSICGEMTL
jgi:L-asparaginase